MVAAPSVRVRASARGTDVRAEIAISTLVIANEISTAMKTAQVSQAAG